MEAWPDAMIASATHDTKRGEDARGRLHALSEMPEDWREAVELFESIAAPHVQALDGEEAPDANDRYLILQALLGAWPVELLDERTEPKAADAFRERIESFVLKALREAKRHTSWVHGNEAYENAATALVGALLDPEGAFLRELRPLARRLAFLGMLNGLARTALKTTLPGVPDIYQGTEFWDYSLVDPDNRRPVDYDARLRGLERGGAMSDLLRHWRDGRVKQALLARVLADRAAHPALYADGDYRPIEAPEGVVAYARSLGDDALIVAVPRLLAGRVEGETLPAAGELWGDAGLPVPRGAWRDILSDREVDARDGTVPFAELFGDFPIALLRPRA
jgi:(1->4)-alpha-D-glucan 1-alpha-D-glucosylmutase